MNNGAQSPETPPGLRSLRRRMRRERFPNITLGEIWVAWKRDRSFLLKALGGRGTLAWRRVTVYTLLGRLYQRHLLTRTDYSLFLLLLQNPKHHWCDLDKLESISTSLPSLAEQTLTSNHPVIVWGGLAVLSWAFTNSLNLEQTTLLRWYENDSPTERFLTDKQRSYISSHQYSCPKCQSARDAVKHLHERYVSWLEEHRQQLLALVPRCEQLIAPAGIKAISGAEKGCALIRIFLWSGAERLRFDIAPERRLSLEYVKAFESNVESAMANLGWYPGEICELDVMAEEHKTKPVLLWSQYLLCTRLCDVFFRIHGVVHHALWDQIWSQELTDLMQKVLMFSAEAYRLSSSARIAEQRMKDSNPRYLMRIGLDTLQANEALMLNRFAQSAKDAGDELLAAATVAYLTRVIPDNVLDSDQYSAKFRHVFDQVAYFVRQVGYEFDARDGRYAWKRSSKHSSMATEDSGKSGCLLNEKELDVDSSDKERASSLPPDPYQLRLAWDQTSNTELTIPSHQSHVNDDWKAVKESFPTLSKIPLEAPLQALVSNAARGADAIRNDTIRSAYRLCLRHYRLADAATLLKNFPTNQSPSSTELLDFAHHVKRALQQMPFCIDARIYRKWQAILRREVRKLPPGEWQRFHTDDVLAVHDMLLGVGTKIVTGASAKRLFIRKLYGNMTSAEARDMLDANKWLRQSGLGVVNADQVHRTIGALSSENLGTPVLLSVAYLGRDRLSLIVANEYGSTWSGTANTPIDCPGILEESKYVTGRLMRRCPLPRVQHGLDKLRRAVVDKSLAAGSSGRWLLLAIDPLLATLPWQALLRPVFRSLCHDALDWVVSLVPSFSWVVAEHQKQRWFSDRPTFIKSDLEKLVRPYSNDCEKQNYAQTTFAKLHSLMAKHEELSKQHSMGWAVVLGHGMWQNGFTTIEANEGPITIEQWMDLAQSHRIIVIHSCYGGHVGEHLLGDLAGIPGIALQIGSRLVCAPSFEVSPDATEMLQLYLAEKSSSRTFGERYLEATQYAEHADNGDGVELYNLYGFANEPVKRVSFL